MAVVGLLAAVLGVLAPAVAAGPARPTSAVVTARDTGDGTAPDPLKVVIDRVSPSVVPTHGDVTVAGQIRNRSAMSWTDLSVYLVTSGEPMTTPAQLSDAVDSDPHVEVGSRIVDTGLYTKVSDLAPGKSTRFLLSVPRGRLGISGKPGVYWLGVHVLGTSDAGRVEGADGRARTFLPLVPPSNPGTRLALGMQLRGHVVRSGDGRLAQPDDWANLVSGSGRLKRLLDLSSSADFPLTWVVDPAVVQAVRSLAAGNPPVELASTHREQGTGDGAAGQGATGAGGAGAGTSTTPPDPGSPEAHAAAWLAEFKAGTTSRPVLALPYGDLDVSAAATHDLPELISRAVALSRKAFVAAHVETSPVVVPTNGTLAPAAFGDLRPAIGVVLGNGVVHGAEGRPLLRRAGGGRVLVAPTNHDIEGARPGDVRSALAVRQRLLADAALHALSGSWSQPLVRLLPAGWDPGDAWRRAAFLRGLDVPWLTGARISDVLHGPASRRPRVSGGDVAYPPDAAQDELPAATLQASSSLIGSSRTLTQVLPDASTVDEAIERQALEASSVWSRFFPGLAAARAAAAQQVVGSWLSRITVRGPSFVVVSSETGTFQVTLENGLDEPVTIGLRPTVVGGGLTVSAPAPVRLPAQGHGSMHIQVTARGIGVHLVTLQPVTPAGTPLGQAETLSIRSSRVGAILWLVMAGGAALLFAAIAFRIGRRIRQRRRTHGPLLQRGTA
ncbi:MAG: hypothetical protein QOK15_366 [Nocardioidaceae bacterium]|nr:hypothetical protein [Nocardioidaceae bacterium]